ncbi:MAG: N-formylglutamate amidohydrolase [Pseudomonadota bacterium]
MGDQNHPETAPLEAVSLSSPDQVSAPVLVSSPHSGRWYPPAFRALSVLGERDLRRSEDAFVDRLVAAAPRLGLPVLSTPYPRAYIDVNRSADEIDPEMFLSPPVPIHAPLADRVQAGLGLIPRVVGAGIAIYGQRLPAEAITERIEEVYRPYHERLTEELTKLKSSFGHVLLLDMHSMPSAPLKATKRWRRGTPDVIIGDAHGTSASGRLSDAAVEILTATGLTVTRNEPYAGGYITRRYGAPKHGFHSLQIEINRSLYMDERHVKALPRFGVIKDMVTRFLGSMRDFVDANPQVLEPRLGLRDAAE